MSTSLHDTLLASMVYSPISEASFLPDDRLSLLVSPKNVRSIVIELGLQPAELDQLVSSITSHARRLFAILVFCHLSQASKQVLDSEWSDADLPLGEELHSTSTTASRPYHFKDNLNALKLAQWSFLAPVLRESTNHVEFPEETILPFDSISTTSRATHFGSLKKVTVSPAHQRLYGKSSETGLAFALKLFDPKRTKPFRREVRNLRTVNKSGSLFVIKCLLSFSTPSLLGLLFPWAEYSLEDLLVCKIDERPFHATPEWAMTQTSHLLRGLQSVHNPNAGPSDVIGRHSDLHPQNILLLKGPNPDGNQAPTLVLSGFRKTKFYSDNTQFDIPSDSGDYEAPECQLQQVAGPTYDIWSLGCIFLDIMVWLLDGPEGLKDFKVKRLQADPLWPQNASDSYFFTLNVEHGDYVGATRRYAVDTAIELCRLKFADDERIVETIRVIDERMLVVEPSLRLDAEELVKVFESLWGSSTDRT